MRRGRAGGQGWHPRGEDLRRRRSGRVVGGRRVVASLRRERGQAREVLRVNRYYDSVIVLRHVM